MDWFNGKQCVACIILFSVSAGWALREAIKNKEDRGKCGTCEKFNQSRNEFLAEKFTRTDRKSLDSLDGWSLASACVRFGFVVFFVIKLTEIL